ncbi:MAG: tetratricopeptide repeat protein [Marinibacterium sp.]
MFHDRYGLPLTTRSGAARDLYVAAVDSFLSASAGTSDAFAAAAAADDSLALAHLGEARAHQMFGRMAEARAALQKARERAGGVTPREAAQIEGLGHLIEGRAADGYALIRAHMADHPRDAMMTQTCMGVFSLIGFSGQSGREAEHLAVAERLAPAYGDDWWFLGQLAFARMEAGRPGPALPAIERSLELNSRNANAAHYRAHLFYEMGETRDGLAFLNDWMADYDRTGLMHCHNAWHIALWSLAVGDVDRMWAIVDADLLPEVSVSPALNILSDLAALYYRAEIAGVAVTADRWAALSAYAAKTFPDPGLAFADVHAALVHAMAGETAALERIARDARGPAADIVARCGDAFGAISAQDWPRALAALTHVMADHARIGGSRAQRDLIVLATANVLLRMGKADEARRMLAMQRPVIDPGGVVKGL